MLTILTLLGHSRDSFEHLYAVLNSSVDEWVVVLDHGQPPIKGATCVHYVGEADFSAMRNQGLELIKEGWVLHLDSDEWFTPLQLEELKDYIDYFEKEVDCLQLPRLNITQTESWLGWPDLRPILHRADTGIRWSRKVEEWPQGVKCMAALEIASLAVVHIQNNPLARAMATEAREKVAAC